jgi:hypothetical protein
MEQIIDPFEAAEIAVEPVYTKHFFGQVWFDLYFCALIKGQGKVPFDPTMHKPEQKRTSITLTVTPLSGSSATFPLERNLIAESREWAGIILPSIKALGKTVKELHAAFVQVEIVPTGETYKDKQGVEKQKTTPKFVAVYPDEFSCQAASDALFGSNNHTEQPTAPNGNGNAEREVALKFLPALATQANKDPLKLAELIAANSLVGKYFTINSPEVIAILS